MRFRDFWVLAAVLGLAGCGRKGEVLVKDSFTLEAANFVHYQVSMAASGRLTLSMRVKEGPPVDMLLMNDEQFEIFQNRWNPKDHGRLEGAFLRNFSGESIRSFDASQALPRGRYHLIFQTARPKSPLLGLSPEPSEVRFSVRRSDLERPEGSPPN